MMTRRIYFSIVLVFVVLFVLFMFSALTTDVLSGDQINQAREETAALPQSDMLLQSAFNEDQLSAADATAAEQAGGDVVIIDSSLDSELSVLTEWCVYNKYDYRVTAQWPAASSVANARVILVGAMNIGQSDLPLLTAYAQTGVPLIFTALPTYETLAASDELMDFFGIERCVSPAYAVEGVKIFSDFFLSKERIYNDDDFYGETDDMHISLPYYVLRTGYEGYVVGLIGKHQASLGIANEELPTLLWRTYTGASQVYVVNTDLFDGEKMLGVLTAFMAQTTDCYLYPVVNARAIVITDYPFLSNENAEVLKERYSRDTLGFERDIVWPNVVKVFSNYNAVPNFFATPWLDQSQAETADTDDTVQYWKEITSLSGVAGLSMNRTSDASLTEAAQEAETFFTENLPGARFYAAYAGSYTDAQWKAYLNSGDTGIMSDVTLLLSSYRERALFAFPSDTVLSALMTSDGFTHESTDDMQLLSFMTALGYDIQQVDMDRALFPQSDADDWSTLSRVWSEGNTYYHDFSAFDTLSVYELEARVRQMLATDYTCVRQGETLTVTLDPYAGDAWFVLRVHNQEVKKVEGGTYEQLLDTAYLIEAQQAEVTITLKQINDLEQPD